MRSDISVGALRRGQGAESRADFVHKLQMALKELARIEPQTWETGLRYCKTPAGEPMVPITDTRCPNPQWRSGSGTGWSSRVRPSKTRQLRVDDLLELRFWLRAAQKCSVDKKAWRRVHSDGGARLHVLLYLGLVFA